MAGEKVTAGGRAKATAGAKVTAGGRAKATAGVRVKVKVMVRAKVTVGMVERVGLMAARADLMMERAVGVVEMPLGVPAVVPVAVVMLHGMEDAVTVVMLVVVRE